MSNGVSFFGTQTVRYANAHLIIFMVGFLDTNLISVVVQLFLTNTEPIFFLFSMSNI